MSRSIILVGRLRAYCTKNLYGFAESYYICTCGICVSRRRSMFDYDKS